MYQPFTIGQTFRIVPPGTAPSVDGRIDLVMARGAFGSGEHETTASCLELLETLEGVQGARVLDVGSGTAILTVAALKLGARRASCVDIDPIAVASGILSCRLNAIEAPVEHLTGTLADSAGNDFDLVLANIYGDILLDIADDLVARTRTGGYLLLSGILWEYNFDVRQRYRHLGCEVKRNKMLEEFSTVLLQRS